MIHFDFDKCFWLVFQAITSKFCFSGKPVGDTVLYFGCRHKNQDYLYEDEIEEYVKDGTLTHLHLAFSRDGPEKLYVQHILRQNMEETWKMLEQGGHIYVCG